MMDSTAVSHFPETVCKNLFVGEHTMLVFRQVTEDDARDLMELNKQLDIDSEYMLYEPNERSVTEEQQTMMIKNMLNSANSTIFVGVDDGKLVGHLTVLGGGTNRIRHRAHIVIGIINAYTGRGIGSRLFEAVEHWRTSTDLSRLELTVMTHNERAIQLYKRLGFEIEGIKQNSMRINNRFVDEYYMGKIYAEELLH
jgi:RimJ/RimL family protein N-acetyltransferase